MRAQARDQQGVTLVELLIGILIASIVSAMLIMGWSSLQRSWSYSVNSSEARDFAQQALARLESEIRDAESPSNQSAIVSAQTSSITLTTAFNLAGAGDPNTLPVLTKYYLSNGTLYRVRDANGNGSLSDDTPQVVVKNVVNTNLFAYSYFDASGNTVQVSQITDGDALLGKVQAVQIHLRVDLNPSHSPIYIDLVTTAQPRDQRQI